jgi:hypothetical protein
MDSDPLDVVLFTLAISIFFLYLESPQPVSARNQQRMTRNFGVLISEAAAEYSKVATHRATYHSTVKSS